MIEVNLHPYAKKGASRGAGFSLPKVLDAIRNAAGGGGIPGDPYIIFAVAMGVVSASVIGFMFLGLRSAREEVDVALTEELAQYERFRSQIERNEALLARRDSIAQRVEVIQDIDAGRYIPAHVMDEVALALPDFTWLTEVTWVQDDPTQFRIAGRAGSTFYITDFSVRLERSRFLRDIQIEGINQAPSEANPEDIVYVFTMLATYESPPLEELESVPLFDESVTQTAVPDTAGGS